MVYTSDDSMAGQVLVAMPGVGDPHFTRSVVYLCAHSAEGAMGLIVNRPLPEAHLTGFLQSLNLEPRASFDGDVLHNGGPVQPERGFVLHSADVSCGEDTLLINDDFAMTASIEMLRLVAQGKGPSRFLVALGYAGWGPGQLEAEVLANGWLSVTPEPKLIHDAQSESKWSRALNLLGVDPQALSGAAGHA